MAQNMEEILDVLRIALESRQLLQPSEESEFGFQFKITVVLNWDLQVQIARSLISRMENKGLKHTRGFINISKFRRIIMNLQLIIFLLSTIVLEPFLSLNLLRVYEGGGYFLLLEKFGEKKKGWQKKEMQGLWWLW